MNMWKRFAKCAVVTVSVLLFVTLCSVGSVHSYGVLAKTRFHIGFDAFDMVVGARGSVDKEVDLGAEGILSNLRPIQSQCYAPVKHSLALGPGELILLTCNAWGPLF